MQDVKTGTFIANARVALQDENLQVALTKMKTGFVDRRSEARAKLPEFDQIRDQARDIKNHTLEHLDYYLERFERKVTEQGGHVHWCTTPEDARQTILDICRRLDVKTVTKGKTMIAEEIGLNDFFEENGIEPIETDLGEYIIQLRKEPPSHIIAPAVHVLKHEVAEAFVEKHVERDPDRSLEEPRELLDEAREELRQKFLDADVGVTGANFLIAETGTSVIVTNEGNGDLTQAIPKAHIVLASLEKVVPTLEDASTIQRVLARSATGQEASVYTTFSTGPRRPDDLDGPGEYHVVLLDNERSKMIGTEFQDMLRCIRCGACLNHCPVYNSVGGHAYGWVYPGPMGSVLTPSLIGVEEAGHLPNASSFCGRCEEVCPMRIPLPKMMRHLREREFDRGLGSQSVRTGIRIWAFYAKRPELYRALANLKFSILGFLGRGKGRFRWLPGAGGWTKYRDFPAPQPGGTFQARWYERGGARSPKS
ncbi:MAG: LutB/LldF family L-lactate oxidation iron-sulfur protein [Pseudomonadota bacterium]|nr:LutB/LldF family L-lactate oxidation iron-sulfur protein [Pseudomonadota bacterium]